MFAGLTHRKFHGLLSLTALLLVIWLTATNSFQPESIFTGALVSVCVAAVVVRRSNFWDDVAAAPVRIVALVRYALVFTRELVRANLVMFAYVWAPRLRIRPAMVSIGTSLEAPMARLIMTSTVTLTPGTLALALIGDTLRLHVLDARSDTADEIREATLGPFERHLARAFG